MMRSSRVPSARLFAVIAVLLLAPLAACGQKPGVADEVAVGAGGSGTGGGGLGSGTGGGTTGSGTAGSGSTGGGSTGGSTGGGTTGGSTGGGTTGGGTTGGTGDGGGTGTGTGTDGGGGTGATVPAGPGDRTGITDSEIVIGIHAPVTGAAPFPQNSFEAGKDIYFQFVNEARGGIHNRRVRVVFRDDRFDPRSAVQACKEMVENDKVFLLVGGGGSDQIGACAQYASTVGVPYLSAGVQEAGLSDLGNYFALSMSYSQQSPLLAQMVTKQFPGTRVAVLVADNDSLSDFYDSVRSALRDQGANIVLERRIPKTTSQTDALGIASQIARNADVVVWNASPVSFINVSQATAGQGWKPQWVGPGVTNGLNTVATVACAGTAAIDNAIFYSPFPQLDAIGAADPDFMPAYQKYTGSDADDLGIALWGLDKLIGQVLDVAGPDVSRESFTALLRSGQAFQTGVFPSVQSSGSPFGGTAVHVLQARCSESRYVTIAQNVTGF